MSRLINIGLPQCSISLWTIRLMIFSYQNSTINGNALLWQNWYYLLIEKLISMWNLSVEGSFDVAKEAMHCQIPFGKIDGGSERSHLPRRCHSLVYTNSTLHHEVVHHFKVHMCVCASNIIISNKWKWCVMKCSLMYFIVLNEQKCWQIDFSWRIPIPIQC